ncbi:hypothetical protein EB118_13495 [bacterium]|nr:hypothetical protein [bacterium]
MLVKNFAAPTLPLPPPQYDVRQQNEFVRALRLYFNLLDRYLTQVTNEINGTMEPFSATSLDAFGRLRVANPYTLFDSQNRYQKDPQFSESLTGSATATYVVNESSVDMAVTATSGDKAVRQTYRVFPYQPGKSLQVLATFVMNSGKTNLRQRVGYFNTDNGVFFQVNGTTKSFVLRTNTSGTPSDARKVDQADWNGDRLDGSGASGITLDITKAQILYMDFEWLGVGSVRCGFVIDGAFIVCHTFNNANDIDKVYMTTAILPVRYEIENTGTTASASTLTQICSTVISEGGYQQTSIEHVARRVNATSASTITTSFYPIVSIRLASGALGAVVVPSSFNFLPTTSDNYEIALIKNPSLTGPSWASVSSDANVQSDIAATAMANGTIVSSSFTTGKSGPVPLVSGGSYNWDLQLGASLANVSDIFTLAARVVTTGGAGSGGGVGSLSFYDLTD